MLVIYLYVFAKYNIKVYSNSDGATTDGFSQTTTHNSCIHLENTHAITWKTNLNLFAITIMDSHPAAMFESQNMVIIWYFWTKQDIWKIMYGWTHPSGFYWAWSDQAKYHSHFPCLCIDDNVVEDQMMVQGWWKSVFLMEDYGKTRNLSFKWLNLAQ